MVGSGGRKREKVEVRRGEEKKKGVGKEGEDRGKEERSKCSNIYKKSKINQDG